MEEATAGAGEFAELLRRFRDRGALSQEELAARAGLTAKAIGALERESAGVRTPTRFDPWPTRSP
jgi:transcriptional regulator with XRE-family HTH domain